MQRQIAAWQDMYNVQETSMLRKGNGCIPLSRSLATAPCAALGGLKSDGTSAVFHVIAPASAADTSPLCPIPILYHRCGSHRPVRSPERAEEL